MAVDKSRPGKNRPVEAGKAGKGGAKRGKAAQAEAPESAAKTPRGRRRVPATRSTKLANRAVKDLLDFGSRQDFEDATRGFVAALDPVIIPGPGGRAAWDMEAYRFIEGDAPDTVNPSLWRQAKLNTISGLFTIHPRIHQVRGHDVSNMTLIAGDTGWIIIDPLLTVETAAASLEFANKHLGKRPVRAIIYTHSHADHFGGVRGVVDESDVRQGRVPILAPDGFMQYAVSENVLAGNAMNRRALYQFGGMLEPSPTGHVCCGLGKALARGTISLIAPTDIVARTGEKRVLDGVEIEFQMANGSEAPAEFMFYFPEFKAICASEVTSHNMHNVLAPRGAEVRNALHWSKYIDETLTLFGSHAELLFASHHWPTWGTANVTAFLARQRDLYRFIHDETLRLVNHGLNMGEIAETIQLPAGLAHDFTCRGYYGTLHHNVKAVYQFYLGWWDGNPATYYQLPRAESGKRMVLAMGGAERVLTEGRRAFAEGDYRWAAEIVNHLVFAEPANAPARALQADILEQIGFQAESGIWRNIFLTGAHELRAGVDRSRAVSTYGPDVLAAMGIDTLLDFLGVKFNSERAGGLQAVVVLHFSDSGETYALEAGNGVLNNSKGRMPRDPDVTLKVTKPAFFRLLGRQATLQALVAEGALSISGRAEVLRALFDLLDEFDPMFELVAPRRNSSVSTKSGSS